MCLCVCRCVYENSCVHALSLKNSLPVPARCGPLVSVRVYVRVCVSVCSCVCWWLCVCTSYHPRNLTWRWCRSIFPTQFSLNSSELLRGAKLAANRSPQPTLCFCARICSSRSRGLSCLSPDTPPSALPAFEAADACSRHSGGTCRREGVAGTKGGVREEKHTAVPIASCACSLVRARKHRRPAG